jgi:hypothetical protein
MSFYQLQRIVAGNNITIMYRVDNQRFVPPIVLDPDGGVTISIRQPDETVVVDAVPMTPVEPGYYRYDFQTLVEGQAGVWMGKAVSLHQAKENASPWESLFNLVPA